MNFFTYISTYYKCGFAFFFHFDLKANVYKYNKKKDYFMSIDITVGIPTYRRPFLLDRALKSVLKQTYKNIFINVSVDYYEKTIKIIK